MTDSDSASVLAGRGHRPLPAGLPPLSWMIPFIIMLAVLGFELFSWASFVNRYSDDHGYVAQTDFISWFAAAHLLTHNHGQQLYDIAAQKAMQDSLIAPYQHIEGADVYLWWPILGGMLLPMIDWSSEAALALWIGVSAGTSLLAILVLARELGSSFRDRVLWGLAAWTFLPHIYDLEQGQTSSLLLLPLSLGLVALRRGAQFQAGCWLGLLCLKPQLALVWAVALLGARCWRALVGGACTTLGLLLASTLITGGVEWIPGWIAISRQGVQATRGNGWEAVYSQNLKPMIALIVGSDSANLLQLGLGGVLLLLVGWLWWRIPVAGQAGRPGNQLIALTTLIMLLATPFLNVHDLTFWIVSGAFLLARAPDSSLRKPQQSGIWLCWVGWLIVWPTITLWLTNPIKVGALYMIVVGGILLLGLLRVSRSAGTHAGITPLS